MAFLKVHSSIISFDDIKQDLYMRILKVVQKDSYQNVSKLELQKIVRRSIRNCILNIFIRGGKSTNIMSDISLNGSMFHNEPLHDAEHIIPLRHNLQKMYNMEHISLSCPNFSSAIYSTPEQACDLNNLKRFIQKWGKNKDNETRLFLKELVEPSDKVLDKWNQLLDNIGSLDSKTGKIQRRSRYNIFKNTGQIPATVFAQTLNMSASKCRRIIKSLANYLKKEGYAIPKLPK